jgi:protein-disulfide isomerase
MSRLAFVTVAFVIVAAGTVAHSEPPRRSDPAVTYAVPLGASPWIGSPSAKVTIVMAMDFSCPYCRRAWETVEQLVEKYGTDLRVVFKPFLIHPTEATPAAYAACAANRQGRWRALADRLWVEAYDANQFEQANIDAIAAEAGLDSEQYQRDITGPCPQEVQTDMALLRRFAVQGTPTFFINGRFIAGARDIADFERLIDEELAKANAAVARGVPADRLYDQEVLAKGVAAAPASGPEPSPGGQPIALSQAPRCRATHTR